MSWAKLRVNKLMSLHAMSLVLGMRLRGSPHEITGDHGWTGRHTIGARFKTFSTLESIGILLVERRARTETYCSVAQSINHLETKMIDEQELSVVTPYPSPQIRRLYSKQCQHENRVHPNHRASDGFRFYI